jgi:dihydrodipicolinate synthase/N-acetylneuraminate lyase
MTGYCDILLPSMMAGLEGSITALANLTPNVVVQQYHLIKSAIETKDWNKLALAQRQSEILSRADWSTMKGGLAGVKWAVGEFWPETGVKDRVRRPLQEASTAVREEMKKELDNIVKMERELEKQSK